MKMIKAVSEKDLSLQGVVVSLQQVDGKVEAITITDASGKYLQIVKDGTYSDALKVLIEEPKEYTTVYKLTVKIDDGVSTYKFDTKSKLDSKISSLFIDEADYRVEEVQVEVQKNLLGQKEDASLDFIPF
jgi:hypothetical protein